MLNCNCHLCAFFLQSILGPLAQLPLFISFFFAIRGMSYLPVESFKTGGYLWFQDLTLYDPYFVLPFICSFSMLASIEVIMNLKFIAAVFCVYLRLCSNDVKETMCIQINWYSVEAENLMASAIGSSN